MISPSQRPLPDNTQHSQQTNIQALGGIRTHDRSRRAAVDLRLRPRAHWDRRFICITLPNCWCTVKQKSIKLCHLNDQLIDNQLYLANCTKTLPVRRLQQTHLVRYCTCLVSTGTTYGRNAPCSSSVFCISFPRLAQRFVFSLFLTFTTPIP